MCKFELCVLEFHLLIINYYYYFIINVKYEYDSPMDSHVWKWAWAGSIGCSRLMNFFRLRQEIEIYQKYAWQANLAPRGRKKVNGMTPNIAFTPLIFTFAGQDEKNLPSWNIMFKT